MDLRNNIAWVNRSSTLIPVYSQMVSSPVHAGGLTAGGSVIGHIHQNEFYTVIGQNDSTTSREINFRNGAGQWVNGYIETEPDSSQPNYAWVSYQEGFHYYCVTGEVKNGAECEHPKVTVKQRDLSQPADTRQAVSRSDCWYKRGCGYNRS